MEIKIDPKTGKPQIRLNESDIAQDRKIREMLQSEGWKILRKYYEVAREQIIEIGKDGIRTRARRELSAEKWAILKGFDEFLMIPERLIMRLKEYDDDLEKKEQQTKKEVENDGLQQPESEFDVIE